MKKLLIIACSLVLLAALWSRLGTTTANSQPSFSQPIEQAVERVRAYAHSVWNFPAESSTVSWISQRIAPDKYEIED